MTRPARFGPLLHADGSVTFRLWAPAARRVELVLDQRRDMPREANGWHQLRVDTAGAGTLYQFGIDGELDVPDPASHFQPHDVHGPSEIIDHAYDWQARDWRGRPWHEAVILEMHVGTFTPEGTFRAAIDRLDHVVQTGFTAIELMPVADFSGRRNWGYDGVLWYAPDSSYGRPEDLKALIDAAHQRGLMVFLDVVYNHFGPDGNYLGRYAPQFFTSHHKTPWGDAIDYRVDEVRAFAVDNALHWLDNYRFDGLRLDAVHAIVEPGEPPVLTEISRAVGELARETGRQIHLVLENDDNRASLLDPGAEQPQGKYHGQWNDDYHHVWHVVLTGETGGYYADYARQARHQLVRALASGFAYQGEPSEHRQGAPRGEPSAGLAPTAFVTFLQNHDQIGNRALGERISVLAAGPAQEAALAVTLLAPMPPLLFMGEEWGSEQPFPFFCDFQGDLADAVREGRRAEFESFFAGQSGDLPDPLSPETFRSAVLDWADAERPPHRQRLDLVRRLLDIRRREIVPRLRGIAGAQAKAATDGDVITVEWRLGDGSRLRLIANLGDAPAARPGDFQPGTPIWGGEPPDRLPPWSVYWSIGAP
jgi:maltooligosyltrehalose trehalohydrolase